MTQSERRIFLIASLLKERKEYRDIGIPTSEVEQRRLLRSLMNVRMPSSISPEFQKIQDEYLQEESRRKGTVSFSDFESLADGFYLWQGDITRMQVDAIVNAANSGMTGCYHPCHSCIDNCIHTFAGIQLRNCCNELMRKQGYPEAEGGAKLTPAFNLPSRYVIHTVGPLVEGNLTEKHREMLSSCYRSCLACAISHQLESIAFCCISTGVFCFPREEAARIAIATCREHRGNLKVVFNVFKTEDAQLYRRLLCRK